MSRNRLWTIQLALTAVLGAGLALGGAALLGKLGSKTTIQQVSPLAQGSGLGNVALQSPTAKGLTPERIYRRDAPGVVQVRATTQTAQSLGSGFVIDKAGHIVTNYHVIQGAPRSQVSFSGQDQVTATVVGNDPSTDIAVLKIDATRPGVHAAAARRLRRGHRRRPGLRDRQPVRVHRDPHERRRQRRAAPDRGAELAASSTMRSRPTPRSTTATRAAR